MLWWAQRGQIAGRGAVDGTPAPVAPVNTVLPLISGTTVVGSTLTTTIGTWTGSPTSYAYQWKRGGSNISGATSSTYLLVSADSGTTVTVTVTATNTAGSSSATSSGVSITSPVNNKAIDGTAGANFSTASTGTVTLTTTQSNDVIILSYFHNGGSGAHTISTVTSAHLTWAKRSQRGWGGGPSDTEIWWATASSPLTSEVITITLAPATNIDDAAYHAFGVSGCPNPASPWDTNASLATAFAFVAPSSSPLTVSGVSTDSPIPMLIGNTGTYNNIAITKPATTTLVRAEQINSGGTLFARTNTFYQNFSSPISSASFSSTPASGANWGMVIDALA